MTNSHTGPSSIRDDSICESSLPPNKSSGDIGERAHAPTNDADLLMWCTACPTESAAEIERLRRINSDLVRDHNNLVLDRAQWQDRAIAAERQHEEAWCGLIEAEFDGSEYASEWKARALTAESAVAAADSAFDHLQMHSFEAHHNVIVPKIEWDAASALRAAVSKKTAESGHSPSTHNSESE